MTLPTEKSPTKICRKSKEEVDKTGTDQHVVAGQTTTKNPDQECESSEESSEEAHRVKPPTKQKRQANPHTTTKRPKTTTRGPQKLGISEEDRTKPKGKQDVRPTVTTTTTHRPPPPTPKHVGRKRRQAKTTTTTTKKPHAGQKPAEVDRSNPQQGKQNPFLSTTTRRPHPTTAKTSQKPAQG